MSVHDGHRQRMMSKLLEHGIETLAPHEVLEILLYYAIPRQDTNPLAHKLIETFGSLHGVFDAPYEELLKVEGIGPKSAGLIKMIPPLLRVYASDETDGQIIDSAESVGAYFLPRFLGYEREIVLLLCLDNKNKAIACVKLSEGNINSTMVSTRRIAEIAIKYNASAIVVAHNHPNGSAVPSREDIQTTRYIMNFCESFGLPFLDHVIVADNDYISLAATGYFSSYR
ncbi:MAG: DNA repair protein RadC [Clostridia bacterium]|nr:DNA repair protein RadC [Clostridia bacterium]